MLVFKLGFESDIKLFETKFILFGWLLTIMGFTMVCHVEESSTFIMNFINLETQ